LCHECGNRYRYLGLHVWKAHRIRTEDYRAKHGLRRTGLVAEDLRQLMAANAARTMDDRPLFVARRSVEAAKQAFLALEVPHSPAGKEALRTALAGPRPRKFHSGNTCEECGATFCNLQRRQRRFCTRSCANTHNRRQRA